MSRHLLKSTISPMIELRTITIHLRADAAVPTVEMEGSLLLSNPRARAVSQAVIKTAHLPPSGAAFIEEMKAVFGGAVTEAPRPKEIKSS
jgi:hypothetical protein